MNGGDIQPIEDTLYIARDYGVTFHPKRYYLYLGAF